MKLIVTLSVLVFCAAATVGYSQQTPPRTSREDALDPSPVDPRVDPQAERIVPYEHIDRARTVFVWGPAPKPGKGGAGAAKPKGPAKTPSGAAKRSSQSKSGSVPAGRKQAGAATATHEEA